jgi:hypothetical protein
MGGKTMKALLLALLIASCGSREVADAIREAQDTPEPTPTPEAVTTEVEQPSIPRKTEEPTSKVQSPQSETQEAPDEVQLPAPTPTVVVVYVPATPAPMPTAEQIAGERQKRFELCRRDNLDTCKQQGATGSAIYTCAERECQDWKTATYAKLGPWKDWVTSQPPY